MTLKDAVRRLMGANAVGGYVRKELLKKRLLPLLPTGQLRIIEAGCGSALNLDAIAPHVSAEKFAGFDIYETELEKARTRFPDGDFFQGDITKPEGDASYDVVINIDVLEHIEDYKAALTGMKSYLKPGGLLYLHTPNETQTRVIPLSSLKELEQDDHERVGFHLATLKGDFEEAGFEILESRRTFGRWVALFWDIDFLLRKLKPLNFIFLPLWKILVRPGIDVDSPSGNGILLIAKVKTPAHEQGS